MNNIQNYLNLIYFGSYLAIIFIVIEYIDLTFKTFKITKNSFFKRIAFRIKQIFKENLYLTTRAHEARVDAVSFTLLILFTILMILTGYFLGLESKLDNKIFELFSLYYLCSHLLRVIIIQRTSIVKEYDFKNFNNLIYLFIPILLINVSINRNLENNLNIFLIYISYALSLFAFMKNYSLERIQISHLNKISLFDRLYFISFVLLLIKMLFINLKYENQYELIITGFVSIVFYLMYQLYKFNTLKISHAHGNKVAKGFLMATLFLLMLKGI